MQVVSKSAKLTEIKFKIILTSTLKSHTWSHSFRFLDKDVRISHARCMTFPTPSILIWSLY
jgi:hypothetical protein